MLRGIKGEPFNLPERSASLHLPKIKEDTLTTTSARTMNYVLKLPRWKDGLTRKERVRFMCGKIQV